MYDERCRCRFRFRIRCRIWIRIRSERWAELSWASPVSYDKVARLKKSSDKTTKCVNRWGNMRNNTLPVTEYKSPSALVASWCCFFFCSLLSWVWCISHLDVVLCLPILSKVVRADGPSASLDLGSWQRKIHANIAFDVRPTIMIRVWNRGWAFQMDCL